MSVKVQDTSETSKKITLEIPFSDYSEEYNILISELSQMGSYKGFRPGKVPKSIVHQTHLKFIIDRLVDTVIGRAIENTLESLSLSPVTGLKLDKIALKDGQPIQCSFSFDYVPEIVLPDFSDYKSTLSLKEVTDEMVDQRLRVLAKKFSTISEAPVGHEIKNNDVVQIEFKVFSSDGTLAADTTTDTVDLGEPNIEPNISPALLGHKVGDTFKIPIKKVQNEDNNSLSTKDYVFDIKIINVSTINLLPIDDDLAIDLNIDNVNNLHELKELLVKELRFYEQQEYQIQRENEVNKYLFNKVSVSFPESLLEFEIDKTIAYQRDFYRQKYAREPKEPLELWLKDKDRRTASKDSAIFSLSIALILSAIAKKYNIKVSDEEVKEAIKLDYADFDNDNPVIDEEKLKSNFGNYKNRILSKKIIERFSDIAQNENLS
jgi:trigger factor